MGTEELEKTAQAIFKGVNKTPEKITTKSFQSRSMELIPVFSFLRKITQKTTEKEIMELLTEEDVRSFSDIKNLEDKVTICWQIKQSRSKKALS